MNPIHKETVMIKHVFVGFLNGINEIDAMRWYFRFHSKEVVRFVGPWLRRYETYRAYLPPPDAKKYGTVGGFMTELWYANVGNFVEAGANNRPYTWAPFFRNAPPGAITVGVTLVPAMPTEDFLGKEPSPEEKHVLRWCRMIKYPDTVSLKDGEEWYLTVHSQEVKQQSGLLKYVSHRVLENPPIQTPWHRVEELWYEDFDAWHKAVIDSPVKYTSPPWGKKEPFVDMVSTFVKYKPDVDFLKDNPIIP
jgi:hypothetical protein